MSQALGYAGLGIDLIGTGLGAYEQFKLADFLEKNPPEGGVRGSPGTTTSRPTDTITIDRDLAAILEEAGIQGMRAGSEISVIQATGLSDSIQGPRLNSAFNALVNKQLAGGDRFSIGLNPTADEVAAAGAEERRGQQEFVDASTRRQFGNVGEFGAAIDEFGRTSSRAIRDAATSTLGTLVQREEDAIRALVPAKVFSLLPLATMSSLRAQSLRDNVDRRVADIDMARGSLALSQAKETADLQLALENSGANPEFISTQMSLLRTRQKYEVNDVVQRVKTDFEALRVKIDLQTQQFVSFASQEATRGLRQVAEIETSYRQMTSNLLTSTNLRIMDAKLQADGLKLAGKETMARLLLGIVEQFIPVADIWDANMAFEIFQEDRERGNVIDAAGQTIAGFQGIAGAGTRMAAFSQTQQEIDRQAAAADDKGGLFGTGIGVSGGAAFGEEGPEFAMGISPA